MGAAPPTGRFQEHKMQQMKRLGVGSGSEDDPGHSGEEETVSFIDLPPNNLSKLPEKGILKKPCPFGGEDPCHKGKWLDDAQSDAQEMLSQSGDNLGPDMLSSGPISEVERNLKSLNSYHEDILEALRTAASRHHGGSGSGSATASSDDLLRRSLAAAAALDTSYNRVNSQDKLCDPSQYPADHLLSRHGSQTHVVMVESNSPTPSGHHHHHRRTNHRTDNQADDEEDEEVHPVGPIRIRNLEDLIRQLEHKTTRHMSPSGSEDIRMSETEADRHYNRLDSQGGRVRGSEFGYGRYRHGPGSSGSGRGYLPEEEGIYESADQDRGPPPDTPDSESDDFIQAQPRLAQLGSGGEEQQRLGYSPPESPCRHDDSPSPHNDQSALLPPGPKYPEYKH
ncbi:ADAM cysteine-rich [Nesidiocoris tenuis]|uniref:ADAM cysteine-rich n=1 Tax=Nesidiocoris tenuis TaxID=355587 RepID=A0ABN7AZ53_9HEMI|nr:ADAM cysteine-rich [Nesidiocoris tenuis]